MAYSDDYCCDDVSYDTFYDGPPQCSCGRVADYDGRSCCLCA